MNMITNTDHKIIHWIIRVWLIIGICFVGYNIFTDIQSGYVYFKYSGKAYRADEPLSFWFMISFQALLIAGMVFYFFKKPNTSLPN